MVNSLGIFEKYGHQINQKQARTLVIKKISFGHSSNLLLISISEKLEAFCFIFQRAFEIAMKKLSFEHFSIL